VGRRSRKRASTATAARPQPAARKPRPEAEVEAEPKPPSRSEIKNAEARAKLEPLEPGERPLAVTIGAIATVGVIVANLVVYFAGVEVRGDRPAFVGFLAFCGLMGVMAWGLWNARYWAVLGLEALLGILILIVALVAMLSSSITDALICVAILVPSIALFWFLIKAMARIQMPERPR
jgi:hypothetical protein